MLSQEQRIHKQNMENLTKLSSFEKTLSNLFSKITKFFKKK